MKQLTEAECKEIIQDVRSGYASDILAKYEKFGYRTLSQLELEVKKVLGRSWHTESEEIVEEDDTRTPMDKMLGIYPKKGNRQKKERTPMDDLLDN